MTARVPRPKSRHWRWLVVVLLILAGVALNEMKQSRARDEWIGKTKLLGLQIVVGIYTPPRGSGPVAAAAARLLSFLGRKEVRVILWTQHDVSHLIDAPRPLPKDTIVYYVETLGSSTGTWLAEQLPDAEIREMSAN